MDQRPRRPELTWMDKDKRPRLDPHVLLEHPELSYSSEGGTTDCGGNANTFCDNRLIHGDNLLALKTLEQEFAGNVKCIYIDPPYNTGNAFKHYDDGLEHSLWLSFMRDRLEILRNLLHPTDGSIWVSIDDYECPYLRVLLDEVLGRTSFIACIVWQKRYSRENRRAIGEVHEYVLAYALDPQRFKAVRNKLPPTPAQTKIYRNLNNDFRGRWRPIPISAQQGHATKSQYYEIVSPSGAVFSPSKGLCWGLPQATFQTLRAEGRVYFGKSGNSQPNIIRYHADVEGFACWTLQRC